MAKLPEYYNLGNKDNLTQEDVLNIIEDIYRRLAIAINRKPDLYVRTSDGQTTDTFLSNGDINLNTSTQKVEMLVGRTATTVTWKTL